MARRAPVSVEQALHAMDMRRFHSAAKMLTGIIEREPDNVAARLARGECYVNIGRYRFARADFLRALKLQPGLPAAELGLALVLAGDEKYEEALAAASKTAKANPSLLKPYAVIGKIHYGLFEAEARECVRICEEDKKNQRALAAAAEVRLGRFGAGEAYWQDWYGRDPAAAAQSGLRKRLDRAKEQFELALRNLTIGAGRTAELPGAGDVDTLLALAAALLGKGDIDEAVQVAGAMALLGGPATVHAAVVKAEALAERADRLMRQGAAENDPKLIERAAKANRESIELLEGVLEKHPDTAPIRDKLVMQYVRAGMFDKAEERLRRTTGQPLTTNARYVRGIVHLAKGEYDDAVSEFLTIREKMLTDPGFHFSLGMAYYRQSAAAASFSFAADEFSTVVKLRPNFVPARFRLAKLYLRKGWHREARDQCEKILAIPGRSRRLNAQVYLMLSEASRGLKDYDQVYEALDAAYREVPSESTLMRQYIFMIGQDKEDEVLRNIAALLDKANDTPTYACIRGYAYLKKGMPKKAVESFEKALILDPQYIMGYVHLAGAYEALNRPLEAVKQCERAIEMVKSLELADNPGLHYRLGVLLVGQGVLSRGETELRRAAELDRKHVPARLRLAALELRRRNFKAALEQARTVTRLAARSPEARLLVGLIYSACARRSDDEIRPEVAERLAKLPPAQRREPTGRDIQIERRMYWGLAVKNYEKAFELDPRSRHSYEVGVIYAVQGKFGKMASVYLRALNVSPPAAKPQLLRRLATAYLCTGDHDNAVKTARQAVDAGRALPKQEPNEELRNRFALANCLIAQGDFSGARAEVGRAKDAVPGFQQAYLEMIGRLVKIDARFTPEAGGKTVRRHVVVGQHLNLGLFFSRAGIVWLPYAERAYNKVIKEDAGNIVALYLLSDLYLVTSRAAKADDPLKKAEDVNRRILKLSAGFAPALRNLAAIEDVRTRAAASAETTPEKRLAAQAKAVELYGAAIRAAPGFWVAKLELATIYQRAGVNDKAMQLYEEVIKLKPNEVRALNDYANLCAEEKKNLDKAVEYAKRAKKLSPFSGAVADTLGVLHTILGDTAAAVEQLEEARSLLPNHPTVLYHLAVAYAKGGKKQEALAILDELLRSVPGHKEAQVLRKELGGN